MALARAQCCPGVPWGNGLVVWRDRPPEADSASFLSQVADTAEQWNPAYTLVGRTLDKRFTSPRALAVRPPPASPKK